MTAVSAKLLNAIGAYRVPNEHIFIYFIFTNELTQDEYDLQKDKYVDCSDHISDRVAFVCEHLLDENSIGFNEAFETDSAIEEDDDCQAWCDECEKVRLKEGEWTDSAMAFANIKIVCNQCYFQIKREKLNT